MNGDDPVKPEPGDAFLSGGEHLAKVLGMSPQSDIEKMAWRLNDFASAESYTWEIIDYAIWLCGGRADPRADAAEATGMYFSVGPDFYTWDYCPECGDEFRPATAVQLHKNARRYVDFFLDECKSTDDFYLCGKCGGKTPFEVAK